MKKISTFAILILLLLSMLLCVIEVMLNLQGKELLTSTQRIWDVVFFGLTLLWGYYDSERKDFDRPFDFGFFVYVFWPIAFPWYLIKTRGLEWIALYIGFIGLWIFPWVAGLVAYSYSS